MARKTLDKSPKDVVLRWLERLRELARTDSLAEMSRFRRMATRNLQVALFVTRPEVYNRVRLHAQALAYKTLLAIVPLLAVVFAIFKGFGGLSSVQDKVEHLLVSNLTGSEEVRAVVHEHLTDFMANIQGGSMGPVSVVILVFSVLSLLGHIEDSVNAVFGITEKRSTILRFVMYWAILTLGPLLLGASLTLTGALQVSSVQSDLSALSGLARVFIAIAPIAMTWLGFTALYLVVPNTRVRVKSAFYAALLAGTTWNILKYLYAFYASHAVTVQNIYGSLAAVPLFMLWIWISWLLVLYGAQLTFAYENAKTFWLEDEAENCNGTGRELAACWLVLEVTRDFLAGNEPRDEGVIAADVGISRRLVDQITSTLVGAGILNRLSPSGLVPGRDPRKITPHDVLALLRHNDGTPLTLPEKTPAHDLEEILSKARDATQEAASTTTFADLAQVRG